MLPEPDLTDGSWRASTCRASVEPDGVGRGGARRAVRPGRRPDPEAHHAPDVPLSGSGSPSSSRGPLENEEQVRQAVARLQDHLLKLLGEGVKVVVE